MDSAARYSIARALLFLTLALVALAPALATPQLFSEYYDWRYFDTVTEIARRSVLWFHQVPLWNPYSCGGEVDLANPQSMEAAPTFLFILLFGTALGTKLALLTYYALAMNGGYRLARHLGCQPQGALLAACGYGLSGYLGMHLSAGHPNFAGVALYPYLLLSYDRALQAPRWLIPLGLWAAWIAVLGGTFTPPLAGVLLVLWASLRAVSAVRATGRFTAAAWPFGALLLGGALALCFGAVRMLPALEFIYQHPRTVVQGKTDFSWPHQILLDLIVWRKYGALAGRRYWAHEYSARLPWALLPLWLGSLALLRRPRSMAAVPSPATAAHGRQVAIFLWVLALTAALLAMGNGLPLPGKRSLLLPWTALQQLPVLRDLRVPSRHLVLITLALAVLAGLSWDRLAAGLRARWPERARLIPWVFGILLCATAADGALYSASLWRGQFTVAHAPIKEPTPFWFVQGHWRTMREDVFAGHGTLGCDEEAPLQRARGVQALHTGDVPQVGLLDKDAGTIGAATVTPNRRVARVTLQRGTTVLFNSNWNEHWRALSPPGAKVVSVEGRLGVAMTAPPAGPVEIVIDYAPRSFYVGAILSALSLPVALWIFLRRRRSASAAG